MLFQHQRPKLFVDDMGINLHGGDIGMAKHGLDGPQIGPARQKMRREGVPKTVGCHPTVRDTRLSGHVLNHAEEAFPRQMAGAGAAWKQETG